MKDSLKSLSFLKWLSLIPILFSITYCLFPAFLTGGFEYDFHTTWMNAKNLIHGVNIYDEGIHKTISDYCFKNFHLYPADTEPRFFASCFALLYPFTLARWETAKWIWLFINFTLTVLLSFEISRSFCSKKYFFFLLAALICSIPWRENCYCGQNAIWSIYFFVLSIKYEEKRNDFLSGVFLALSLFKYSLTIPLCFYFLAHKRVWRNIAWAAGIHLALNLFFSYFLHKSIFYLLWAPFHWILKGTNPNDTGYSLFKFFSLLKINSNWVPLAVSGLIFTSLIIWIFKKRSKDNLGILALLSMIVAIASYHGLYDYRAPLKIPV
ncbi:MAG: glycosyltransferase family 87 protein [bacterium]